MMKKSVLNILLAGLLLFSFSCKKNECCTVADKADNPALVGSWLLYEQGYSPGAGYIVEEVAPDPAQIITFEADHKVISTIPGFTDFKFYSIVDDSLSSNKILELYKSIPRTQPKDATLVACYSFEIKGDSLKLQFRFCIEGCHLGLKRIK